MKPHVTALLASLVLGAGSIVAATTPEGLSTSDWHSILAAHDAAKRAFVTNEDGTHSALTPSQGWHVQFDGRGFAVSPKSADWQWGLRLQSYAFGTECTDLDSPASTSSEANRLTYRWDDVLQEWFVNAPNGLLQGWTITRLPEKADPSQIRLMLAVTGDLEPCVSEDGRSVGFNTTTGSTTITYSGLRAWDADGREVPVSVAGIPNEPRAFALRIDASHARFPVTIDPIAQQAYLKAFNAQEDDGFGRSVAISGDTVVVGAPKEDSNATWVGGNHLDNSATEAGAAYVFVRSGSKWTQQAYLKPSNTGAGDLFGASVAVSGDTVAVGAYGERSNATGVNGNASDDSLNIAGAAFVFVRSGELWTQQAYLKASNTGSGDLFGYSVAVSGDTIVVGAFAEGSAAKGVNGVQADDPKGYQSGAAYVFVRSGSTWAQQAYLKASNTGAIDYFGGAVAISGDTVVVGAIWEDSNGSGDADNSANEAGAAYVFERGGTSWGQQAYLKASNVGAYDEFGYSVAVSGDTIVIGARSEASSATGINGDEDDNSRPNAGAAYIFTRNAKEWTQLAYLKSSNAYTIDGFGTAVAIFGDRIVVSAPSEDSSAAGVNGDQGNDDLEDSGAVYVFERTGSSWMQQAYLKASNTGKSDFFGGAVAISGDTVVVGARGEDSGATGISNGADPNNNSALDAGAAYIFSISSPAHPPTVSSRARTRVTTSRYRLVLRGTSEDATLVEYKAGNGGFKPAKGSPPTWKIPVRLKSTRTVVSVRATGPGGTSPLLKFKIRRK